MQTFTGVCMGLTCLLIPGLLVVWWIFLYALGLGALRLPGVSREEAAKGKAWTSVPDVARRGTEIAGILIGLIGALFALLGFLLPWLSARVGVSGALLESLTELVPMIKDIGQFSGDWNGASIALVSLAVGIYLAQSGIQGAVFGGIALLLLSLAMWLLLLVLLLLVVLEVMALVAVGRARRPARMFGGWHEALLALAWALSILFLIIVQASLGGTAKFAGMQASIAPGGGFWITLGGLLLVAIGAFFSGILAETLERWARSLAQLQEG
ncbi:MAG: hypothetical protein D6793_09615 [Thermoflexia bacterium]|nr:MAG: hypothetical protein D6793_09615 [Thermoflexia bacterium]